MKSELPFQAFINLITFDQETLAFESESKKNIQEINELKEQQALLAEQLEKVNAVAHEAKKQVDLNELEMKEFEQQEKEEKRRLDSIKSKREYDAIMNEIITLQQKQHDNEETLVAVWNTLEEAEKKQKSQRAEYDGKVAALEKAIQEKEEKAKELQATLTERQQERGPQEKIVPEEWLEKYAIMRERVSDPVVPVINGECSACYYVVTNQDLIFLNRKRLLQCKGCFRFLYTQAIKEASESTEKE